ncbi:MAG: uncharacterized protein KVP18_003352 [Porospora cf. gigantea A]|nr:MAG: hypothetical protein KVP18_003352 [Porospora cf. gigantea A]
MSLSRFLTPDLLEVSNEWNAGVSNEFAKLSDGAQEVYLPLVLHLTKESLALVSMDALPTAVGQLTGRLSTWPGGSLITCRVVETLIEALIDRPISEPPHVDCLVSCVRMTLFILQDAAGDTWVRDLPSVIALVSQAFSLARLARAFSSLFLRITASGMTDDGLYAIVEQVADLIKGAFDGMMYALRNPQLLRLHPQWFARVRSASTRWQLELDRSVDSMQSLRRRRAKKRCVVPEVIGRQPSQPRITEVSAVHESDSESSGELGDGEFGWVTGDHQEEFANVAGTGSEGLMSSNLQPHWAAFINSLFGSQ